MRHIPKRTLQLTFVILMVTTSFSYVLSEYGSDPYGFYWNNQDWWWSTNDVYEPFTGSVKSFNLIYPSLGPFMDGSTMEVEARSWDFGYHSPLVLPGSRCEDRARYICVSASSECTGPGLDAFVTGPAFMGNQNTVDTYVVARHILNGDTSNQRFTSFNGTHSSSGDFVPPIVFRNCPAPNTKQS